MTSSPTADQHRNLADGFLALLEGVSDWNASTPVPEWTVRDVAEHMFWFHDFVHAGSPFGWTRRIDPTGDVVAAFREQSAAVQNILDDPAQAESGFSHPYVPPSSLEEAAARFYVADLFMHTWDLARATGHEHALDETTAAAMLDGMRQVEEMLRSSGQYGPAHPVSSDAAAVEQLMAFVGRDPQWSPTT